jgi:hypothetical protein
MDISNLQPVNHAASSQGLTFMLLPATVVATVITQVWISFRERAQRDSRQKATLAAIKFEFEEITASLCAFWTKVQNAWDESSRDALVRFCTLPYPEGSVAAWVSSLRALLPMLSTDQIREKIEWLYATEALNMLRKSLVDDYERFCLYEKSRNVDDGEEQRELAIVQSSWIMTVTPRIVEYKNIMERLHAMRNKLLSRQCNSI